MLGEDPRMWTPHKSGSRILGPFSSQVCFIPMIHAEKNCLGLVDLFLTEKQKTQVLGTENKFMLPW